MSTAVLCAVLIGYFLTQSGFINCISGASTLSFSIDYSRIRSASSISFYAVFVPEQDVFGAVWLSNNRGESSMIYADYRSADAVLTSYGLIPRQQISSLTDTTTLEQGGFVYLGQLNVVNGIIPTPTASFNTSEIYLLLNKSNLIYSNGNSEIWCVSSSG
jgi:uncharacterized membrane protein